MISDRRDLWILFILVLLPRGSQSAGGGGVASGTTGAGGGAGGTGTTVAGGGQAAGGTAASPTAAPYSTDLDTALKNKLLTDYEASIRPVRSVTIMTTLFLMTLNSLDIKKQAFSVTLYFHFTWQDKRLSWDDDITYSNIEFIYATESEFWTPSLIVENAIDAFDVISKPNVLLRVNNGLVTWTPAGIYRTYCESDVTYWPLDDQSCEIHLSTWSHTIHDVSLELDGTLGGIVTTSYQGNGEWDLIDVSNTSTSVSRDNQNTFSRLVFSFHLRRRPIFYLMNTIMPVVLLAFLTVMVFKLSPESGERVGLALTMLLAYAVYLTLISQNIPQTSTSTSILSVYLTTISILQAISVALTVFYLDMYFKPEEKPVPKSLQILVKCCPIRLSRLNCLRAKKQITPLKSFDKTNMDTKGVGITAVDTKEERVEVDISHDSVGGNTADTETLVSASGTQTDRYTWKQIVLILDTITMYIYLFLVTLLTAICMGMLALRV